MGALRMAAWLQRSVRGRAGARIVGLHVLDERVRTAYSERRAEQLVSATADALHGHLAALGIRDAFEELHSVFAETPEAGLTAAAGTLGVDGVVIGRIARSDDATPWRLGSVARRLLRHLPAPIMVVPPDLADVGAGPVLLATDLRDASVPAAQLAARLARELGRELLVAHVDPALVLSTSQIGYGIPMPIEMQPRTIDDVERWVGALRLGRVSVRLLEGDVIDRLLHCARQAQAPFVVCGSRRLGVAERIFGSSVGSELARRADRPVLVVPPAAT